MGKIDISPTGGFKGDVQDIVDLFQKTNSNLSDYIQKQPPAKKSVSHIWIFVFGFMFFAACCTSWIGTPYVMCNKIAVMSTFFLLAGSLITIHIRFENWTATTLAFLLGGVSIAVSTGLYSPQDAAKKINDNLPSISKEKK